MCKDRKDYTKQDRARSEAIRDSNIVPMTTHSACVAKVEEDIAKCQSFLEVSDDVWTSQEEIDHANSHLVAWLALRAVLERHVPKEVYEDMTSDSFDKITVCATCADGSDYPTNPNGKFVRFPCPTVSAITQALEGRG